MKQFITLSNIKVSDRWINWTQRKWNRANNLAKSRLPSVDITASGWQIYWLAWLLLRATVGISVVLVFQGFVGLRKRAEVQYDSQSSYKTRDAQPGRTAAAADTQQSSHETDAAQSSPRSAARTSPSRTSTRQSRTSSASPLRSTAPSSPDQKP